MIEVHKRSAVDGRVEVVGKFDGDRQGVMEGVELAKSLGGDVTVMDVIGGFMSGSDMYCVFWKNGSWKRSADNLPDRFAVREPSVPSVGRGFLVMLGMSTFGLFPVWPGALVPMFIFMCAPLPWSIAVFALLWMLPWFLMGYYG